ncbi:undecaprenyl/decaprenyl-phosphate alpha-N-acetylglucosaminyl 1-phosphate transferase [Brumimicrobium glaciale]|jgi:UDP-GlcNAc:undecaprenyl-phosphate GlcNAc-1-phosphate transferase|uniref:Undecaprenyl/decaprenyl-phosphate alpha-N-acetylglucosaminyl 1-phosphate transferase n=1 Tax=Brumimicrobium glaciale TaxID=200475 RepID=A0A4Q4KQD9_9FLAO|nr:MraY family glycosyltransferase [Brumimicrobium glaciale]RYM35696.1 undecaprenyl/decaprenyl-phosphate alpha-N-acetylglucosaminyl 1-phosphate transferase [Brumimicrobium glaciale]
MKLSLVTEYIIYLLGAFLVSFIINKLVLRFAKSLGIRNKNDVVVRWSNTSKPSLGGISLYFTFIVSALFYAITSSNDNIFDNIEFVGLITAATLAFVIGVADDAYNTKPLLKLFGQIFCGVIFVYTDNAIDIFHLPVLDGLITVLWVVAVMNSLNMLDNMDGITGTVSLFILVTCLVVFGFFNDPSNLLWSILIIAEIGALTAFLSYNIHPAKMFMGDTGSQFIALFVSFFGIKALWNLPSHFELPSWSAVFLILAAFTPAVADTLTVVINRTKRGVSVMLGGKDHTTHHMVYKGYSELKVWVIFLVISILSTVIAFIIGYFISLGYLVPSLAGLVLFVVVFVLLYRNTIKYKEPEKVE